MSTSNNLKHRWSLRVVSTLFHSRIYEMNFNTLRTLWTAGASRKEIVFSWAFAVVAFGTWEYYSQKPKYEINGQRKLLEEKSKS